MVVADASGCTVAGSSRFGAARRLSHPRSAVMRRTIAARGVIRPSSARAMALGYHEDGARGASGALALPVQPKRVPAPPAEARVVSVHDLVAARPRRIPNRKARAAR